MSFLIRAIFCFAAFCFAPLSLIGGSPQSLLIVAGDNYEEFHAFRHFIDPQLKRELEEKGWVIGECPWPSLTADILEKFQAVIFLQTPDTYIKADKDAQLASMDTLLKDYLAKGGGVMIFPDLFRGTVHKTINTWLAPYGLKSLPQTVMESPRGQWPFDAYPAMGVATTTQVTPDRLTEGVLKFVYPEGNELTTTFLAEPAWQVLIRGEKTARTVANEGVAEQDDLVSESPPIVAVRDAGAGRMAYWSAHSSFFILKPYHSYWDNGRVLKEGDDVRLLDNILSWLAANPTGKLGGFQAQSQDRLFHFEQQRERLSAQEFHLPGRARKGLIGLQSTFSGGSLSIKELCSEARRLKLDYVVFTEDAEAMSDSQRWSAYVKACSEMTDSEFVAFPGVLTQSRETLDWAVIFNLRKPWPETPWNRGDFDAFVRIGVNNAWRAFFALLEPEKAPVSVANQGAVNALAVQTWRADEAPSDASQLFQRTQQEMWGFHPIRYRAVRTMDELTEAADQGAMYLYAEKWGRDFNVSQDEITMSAISEGPVLQEFSAKADSTWSPPYDSQYRGRVKVTNLRPGQRVELWFSQNRMRAVIAMSEEVSFDYSFLAAGAGHVFVRVMDKDEQTILQASAYKFSKLRFSSFVGSDRMNGYWYPVRKAKADEPGSVFIDGAYGVIGTTVYPQIAWGDHWFFRSRNQMESEPLGFEVGAPPGSIERMWSGFYLKGDEGWETLAPWRAMSFFSSDASVWSDTDVAVRRETVVDGERRISIEPSELLERKSDVVGFRWDEHAVLWVAAEARGKYGVDLDLAKLPEQRALALRLGDAWGKFHDLSIHRKSGSLEQVPLQDGSAFSLKTGDGISLGDVPMGMVSVWALQELEGDVTEASGRPLLQLRLPEKDWSQVREGAVTASYLVVISNHQSSEMPRTLASVREAVFVENFWMPESVDAVSAQEGVDGFRQSLSINSGGAWGRWKRPGKPWRAVIQGFRPHCSVGMFWRIDAGWKWQPVETTGEKGLAFLSEAPDGRVFAGQPIITDRTDIKVELSRLPDRAESWKVSVHNPTEKMVQGTLMVHPSLAKILSISAPQISLDPGESGTWDIQIAH